MLGGILYCLNLNLSMCYRIASRSPVTFKMELSVKTFNNSSELLPFFATKSSILDLA